MPEIYANCARSRSFIELNDLQFFTELVSAAPPPVAPSCCREVRSSAGPWSLSLLRPEQ